jgi:CheY-like chemotaxis protein
VAHNSILRQQYFLTGEYAASTSATAARSLRGTRKLRKPNRNRPCSGEQTNLIGRECCPNANGLRHAGSARVRHRPSPELSIPAVAPLPLNQNEHIDSVIARFAARQPMPPCRVLIVDDDELVLCRISSLLEGSGYEVCTAPSGEDALRILNVVTCSIVITDWHMAGMDGLDLCREIRSRVNHAYTYVLMLTVRNGSGDSLAALSAGADDYVVKGATVEEILARLEVGRRPT